MEKMRINDMEILTDNVFQTIIENFPDIVHSVDSEGHIVMTNKTAERLLGYNRNELLSMNIRNLYADEVLKALDKGFKNLKKSGDFSVESMLKDKKGNKIPVEIRSFSIYDEDGNFIRTFSVLRDIRKIKELQNTLLQAERMAAIGELASGIAHDINNPLMVISGCCELMEGVFKNIAPDQRDNTFVELEDYMEDIGRAAKSIEKISRHLLNFSRGLSEKPQVTDLHKCIEEALFLVRSKITLHGITIDNQASPHTHYSLVSSSRIEQVISNLISNACDAMAECPRRQLTVKTYAEEMKGAPFVRVDVMDTGTGIPREKMKYIFNSFFTTKEKGKGTGLGLSTSRGIIEDYGGSIMVQSEMGAGTTFSVFLPATTAPAEPEGADEVEAR